MEIIHNDDDDSAALHDIMEIIHNDKDNNKLPQTDSERLHR